jgi:hypothetical protein
VGDAAFHLEGLEEDTACHAEGLVVEERPHQAQRTPESHRIEPSSLLLIVTDRNFDKTYPSLSGAQTRLIASRPRVQIAGSSRLDCAHDIAVPLLSQPCVFRLRSCVRKRRSQESRLSLPRGVDSHLPDGRLALLGGNVVILRLYGASCIPSVFGISHTQNPCDIQRWFRC